MRKTQPRNIEDIWQKLGQLLNLFTPDKCANYFVHAGYGFLLNESCSSFSIFSRDPISGMEKLTVRRFHYASFNT